MSISLDLIRALQFADIDSDRPHIAIRQPFDGPHIPEIPMMRADVIREELTAAEFAKRYDIHPTMITGWKKAAIVKALML